MQGVACVFLLLRFIAYKSVVCSGQMLNVFTSGEPLTDFSSHLPTTSSDKHNPTHRYIRLNMISLLRAHLRRVRSRFSSLDKTQTRLSCLYSIFSLVTVSSAPLNHSCLPPYMPLALVGSSLIHILAVRIVTTSPYPLHDSVLTLASPDHPASLRPWFNLHKVSLPLSLIASVSCLTLLGQIGLCEFTPRLYVQVTTLTLSTGVITLSLLTYSLTLLHHHLLSTPSSSEGPILLSWARCSCCPRPLKKILSLSPFVTLAIFAVSTAATHWNQSCDKPLHEFLIATAAVFVSYVAIGSAIFFGGRDRRSGVVVTLLVTTTLAGMGIGGAGVAWLSDGGGDCEGGSPGLYAAAAVMKVAVLSTSCFVGVFGCCCKVENCIHFDESLLLEVDGEGERKGKQRNGRLRMEMEKDDRL